MSQTQAEMSAYAQVVAKAWASDQFKAKFQQDPKGVLRDHGWSIPDSVTVTVAPGNGKVTLTLPLPDKPPGLSADALKPLTDLIGCCTT